MEVKVEDGFDEHPTSAREIVTINACLHRRPRIRLEKTRDNGLMSI